MFNQNDTSNNSDSNQAVNPKKLYVGNLAYSVTDDRLHEIFGQFGEIAEAKVISDFQSGRSKGFAFVEFGGENAEEAAQAAIEALNNQEIDGRQVFINLARPQAPRQGGDRGGFRGGNRGGFNRGGNGGFRGRDNHRGDGGYRGRDNDR